MFAGGKSLVGEALTSQSKSEKHIKNSLPEEPHSDLLSGMHT